MRIIIGIIFIVTAPLGTIYFRNYHGKIIPYPFLWYAGFVLLEFLGWLLVYWSIKRRIKAAAKPYIAETENLIANGEKIEPDFDHCEFKSSSYYREVEDPRFSSIKWMAPASIALAGDTTTTEKISQSYFVYYHAINDQIEKFISHAFPFDEVTLKFHVMQHDIILYVDRFDRNKYFFDLKTQPSKLT